MKKRRLKLIIKHKKFEKIQYVEAAPDKGVNFPLSIKEVEGFVEKARNERPTAVEGIETIRLWNRPESLRLSIYGAYHSYKSHRSNKGAIIDIYPLKKEGEFYRMYLYLKELEVKFPVTDDIKDRPYILLTKEQAKKELLHTLGHELGHSLIYNLEKRLHGEDIERQCDLWAQRLGGETLTYEEWKKFIVYQDGMEIGTLEQVV